MFETFSRSYYVGQLYVEPHDGEHAAMHREQHEQLNEELYASGTGVERLDNPLVMKVDRNHFAVHGDDAVPENTLAIPRSRVESRYTDPLPTTREVLLAKADRAAQLLDLFTEPRFDAGT